MPKSYQEFEELVKTLIETSAEMNLKFRALLTEHQATLSENARLEALVDKLMSGSANVVG